jgi:hypothetical protein
LMARISPLGEERRRIQEQDEVLGMSISEFAILDECKASLIPYEELWILVQELRQNHTAWNDGPVFALDAEKVGFSMGFSVLGF